MKAYIVMLNSGDGYGHGSSEYLAVCLTEADADRVVEENRSREGTYSRLCIEETILIVYPPKETKS